MKLCPVAILVLFCAATGYQLGMWHANAKMRTNVVRELIALESPVNDLNAGDVARLVSRHAHPRIASADLTWLDKQEHIPLRGPKYTNGWFLSVEKRLYREWTNAQGATKTHDRSANNIIRK